MARRISYTSKKAPVVVVTTYRAWVYGNLVLPSTAYRDMIPRLCAHTFHCVSAGWVSVPFS